jgi:hypothetical protein
MLIRVVDLPKHCVAVFACDSMRLLGCAVNDSLAIWSWAETQNWIRADHVAVHCLLVLGMDCRLRLQNLVDKILLAINIAFGLHANDASFV